MMAPSHNSIVDEYLAIRTWGEWRQFLARDWPHHYTMTRACADVHSPCVSGHQWQAHVEGWPSWSELATRLQYITQHKTSRELGHSVREYDRLVAVEGLTDQCVMMGFDPDPLDITIHVQQPGHLLKLHVDNIVQMHGAEWDDHAFDHRLRQPAGTQPLHRWFVALEDWSPGQSFQFGEHTWSTWSRGDVVSFDWRSVHHGSANYGWSPRPMLRITGTRSHTPSPAPWRWSCTQ